MRCEARRTRQSGKNKQRQPHARRFIRPKRRTPSSSLCTHTFSTRWTRLIFASVVASLSSSLLAHCTLPPMRVCVCRDRKRMCACVVVQYIRARSDGLLRMSQRMRRKKRVVRARTHVHTRKRLDSVHVCVCVSVWAPLKRRRQRLVCIPLTSFVRGEAAMSMFRR